MSTPVLELTAIHHAYGPTPALAGVGVRVDAGEVLAVTGPSGCGKSTLLHVSAGILAPKEGTVDLLGQDLGGLDEAARTRLRRERLGIVLQYGQLVGDLSLVDNVALPLMLAGTDRTQARDAAVAALERAGVEAPAGTRPGELSGGQAQRVAVARALIARPALILADEPTASLDTAGGEELLALLLAAAHEDQAAVIIVTHDNLVAARADRELRLRDGRVEAETVLA